MIPDDPISPEPPSKTQRKKEMLALQELGKNLIAFSESQLDRLALSEKLRVAIREYRRLPNSHGAKKRQLQYIGRLMRDYDLAELEKEVEQVLQHGRKPDASNTENSYLESCCAMVLDGEEGINSLLVKHPHLQRQALRKYLLDFRKKRSDPDTAALESIRKNLLTYLKSELE